MTLDVSSPRVVAAVSEDAPRKAYEAHDEGADAVEVRVDMYDDAETALADIRDCDSLPVIATNRASNETTEDERVGALVCASEDAAAVDVDISSPNESVERIVNAADENNTTVIASHHDFDRTPSVDSMYATLEEAWEVGNVAKLAVTPNDEGDVLDLLRLTLEARDEGDGPFCSISMGALGSYTRFVAPLYGSCLTYASFGGGTAPGQLSVREVNEYMERFSP
ncbi:MAG: type I 3-dehydroquinate dehydratase [Halobacteria archaeon]